MEVKLRPLVESDALVSYKWRNNPRVWEYTGSRPDKEITPEIETGWIKNILLRSDERRYAIVVDGVYVGNVQLTGITARQAIFHIFIGDTNYWGRGIATQALRHIIDIARDDLKLSNILLEVNKNNLAAIRVYKKCGFKETKDGFEANFLSMELAL